MDPAPTEDMVYNWYVFYSPEPTVSTGDRAPTPTGDAANVLSILGRTYGTDSNLSSINVFPDWGQSIYAEFNDDGEYVLNNLNYQGIEFNSQKMYPVYEYLHVDYYTEDANITFKVFLISSDGVETPVTLDVSTTGQWNSVDIPLTLFTPNLT